MSLSREGTAKSVSLQRRDSEEKSGHKWPTPVYKRKKAFNRDELLLEEQLLTCTRRPRSRWKKFETASWGRLGTQDVVRKCASPCCGKKVCGDAPPPLTSPPPPLTVFVCCAEYSKRRRACNAVASVDMLHRM